VRRVRTASGAVAVQLVVKDHGEVVEIEHLGSAHNDGELALLLAAARELLQPGQQALDLGELAVEPARVTDIADWTRPAAGPGHHPPADLAPTPSPGRPRADRAGGRVVSTSALALWNVLLDAYARLGFDALADVAFRAMVCARVVEPTSKADTVRVLEEIGAPASAVRTLFRALARCTERDYRGRLVKACLAHATRNGALGLVLYDVTTLHFEAENEDALRKVGMSKERRSTRRSRSGCSSTPRGSRWRCTASRATPPRPAPCSRSWKRSGNATTALTWSWSPTPGCCRRRI
jgi:hypothetical protein